MRQFLKKLLQFLKETTRSWSAHHVPRLGAALAFYTIFAIAPLFIIVLGIAGFLFGKEAAQNQLFDQISGLVGKESGEAVQSVVAAAHKPIAGAWATGVALVTLFFGATRVFAQLQDSLNTIWNVRPQPGRGIRYFIRKRLLSFAMVLGLGFLLLVSLVVNAVLAAISNKAGQWLSNETFWQFANPVISLGVVALLFAMMFKVLPDVKIAWSDVWVGAAITAVLFDLGKFVLGLYLGKSSFSSAYGAAGSLVIILVWVYYSAQILFFGAEITRLYAMKFGSHIEPAHGAEFVAVKEVKQKPYSGGRYKIAHH